MDVRLRAKKAYRQWMADPLYPSLHYKKIHETLPVWSVRIDRNYRAVGIVQDKKMLWYFIGTHAEYDRLIKSL